MNEVSIVYETFYLKFLCLPSIQTVFENYLRTVFISLMKTTGILEVPNLSLYFYAYSLSDGL